MLNSYCWLETAQNIAIYIIKYTQGPKINIQNLTLGTSAAVALSKNNDRKLTVCNFQSVTSQAFFDSIKIHIFEKYESVNFRASRNSFINSVFWPVVLIKKFKKLVSNFVSTSNSVQICIVKGNRTVTFGNYVSYFIQVLRSKINIFS